MKIRSTGARDHKLKTVHGTGSTPSKTKLDRLVRLNLAPPLPVTVVCPTSDTLELCRTLTPSPPVPVPLPLIVQLLHVAPAALYTSIPSPSLSVSDTFTKWR